MATSFHTTLHAGVVKESMGLDFYRNLAENLGDYKAGATNVEVFDVNGNSVGIIPVVPDFSPMVTPDDYLSHTSLAGGQSWLVGSQHTSDPTTAYFNFRNTPTSETYRVITNVEDATLDLSAQRLNKVVTDVVHWDLVSDDAAPLHTSDFTDSYLWRVGAGDIHLIDDNYELVGMYQDSYECVTAGSTSIMGLGSEKVTVSNGRGESEEVVLYKVYTNPISTDEPNDFVPVGGHMGDSGSPVIVFDEESQSFKLLGILRQAYANSYEDFRNSSVYSEDYFNYVIDSSAQTLAPDQSSVTISGADAQGIVTLEGKDGATETIQALKQGTRGETSTVGTLASNADMWAAKDWVMSNGNMELNFTGDVNTGAGSFQFRRSSESNAQNLANYELNASDSSVNVQTAGYIIDEHVYVKSLLTGQEGDEWRIVGENARLNADGSYGSYGGIIEIAGEGDNNVDLNLGVGVTVHLNRSNGHAAQDVKIYTGANVIIENADQIAGQIFFGNGGGVLDTNGNYFSRNSSTLYTFDYDARIVNLKEGSESHFVYNHRTDADSNTLTAGFYDGKSLSAESTAVLNVELRASSGNTQTLFVQNSSTISGDFVFNSIIAEISGYQQAIANPDMKPGDPDYAPAYDEDKWIGVNLSMDNLHVKDESQLRLGDYASVKSNTLYVDASSHLQASSRASYEGQINIAGQAQFEQGFKINGGVHLQYGASMSIGSQSVDQFSAAGEVHILSNSGDNAHLQTDKVLLSAGNTRANFDQGILGLGSTLLFGLGEMSVSNLDKTKDGTMTQQEFNNVHIKRAQLSSGSNITLDNAQFTNSEITRSSFVVAEGGAIIQSSEIGADVSFTLSAGSKLELKNVLITDYDSQTFTSLTRSSIGLDDAVNLSEVTIELEIAASSEITTDEGQNLKVYQINGMQELLTEVSIADELTLDIQGIKLESDELIAFDLAGLTDYSQLQQVRFVSGGIEFDVPLDGYTGGILNGTVVPEPSTATLSLLALAGLMSRRRRRCA